MRRRLGLLALALALDLPFLGQALHHDESTDLKLAAAVYADPTDPYPGTVDNMGYRWSARLWNNPPLLHYLLAPAAGWAPRHIFVAAHLTLLPFVLLLWWALQMLGRYGPGYFGQALILTSPLVVILEHAVARDVPVLSCELLALGLLVRGAERGRSVLLAALPAAAAMLLSYHAARILGPMLVLAALLGLPKRTMLKLVALSVLPVGLLQVWTLAIWGQPHLYLILFEPEMRLAYSIMGSPWLDGRMNILASLGCWPAFAAVCCVAAKTPWRLVLSVLAGIGMAAYSPVLGLGLRVQLAIWCGAGVFILLLAASESLRACAQGRRDGWLSVGPVGVWVTWFWLDALFWAVGPVHGTARYVLVTTAPIAYFIDAAWRRHGLSRRLAAAVVLFNVLVALLLSAADFEEVQARELAPATLAHYTAAPGRAFFVGEWAYSAWTRAGFQYLYHGEPLRSGDRIVRPVKTATEVWLLNPALLDELEPARVELKPVEARWPVRLMDRESQAGFWWSGDGLLPMGFSRAPVEVLEVYECRPLPPFLRAVRALERSRVTMARFADGVPRAVLFLHPPGDVVYDLEPGAGTLELGLALHPDAGSGDGAELGVSFEPASHGSRLELARLRATDAHWKTERLRIEVPAGGGRLVLRAGPGAAGDFQYDWLCVRPAWVEEHAPKVLGARVSATGPQESD